MIHYKIIYQKNKTKKNIYKKLNLEDVIVGNIKNSAGVFYTPTCYNKWIDQEEVLKIFKDYDVIQTIVSNEKFKGILKAHKRFNLTITDCEFYGLNSDELEELLGYEDIDDYTLCELLKREEYKLKKVIFRTKSKSELFVSRNGIIGINEWTKNNDIEDIKLLIDFINIGPKVFQ